MQFMVVFNFISLVMADRGTQGLAFLVAFILFLTEAALIQKYLYGPFIKRLKGGKDDKAKQKTNPQLQNELDYADYLVWTANKGYTPQINKADAATL